MTIALDKLADKVVEQMEGRKKLNVAVPSDSIARDLAALMKVRGFAAEADTALMGTPPKLEASPVVIVRRRRRA